MKNDEILDALNLLDDDMIETVETLRIQKRKRKNPWMHWVSMAACICIVLVGIYALSRATSNDSVKKTAMEETGDATLQPDANMESIQETDTDEATKDNMSNQASGENVLTESNTYFTDFAVNLFQTTHTVGDNTLVSPLSVLCALSMTANGANGETLSQMEKVLGRPVNELNTAIYHYTTNLPQAENYQLSLANSIWFTDDERFTVNQDFLNVNGDYFSADINQAPFNSSTVQEINKWVKQETNGMIPKILDKIPHGTDEIVMYLVNGLAFEAKWENTYTKNQVHSGTFTQENETTQIAEFMYSEENHYLEDDKATGFMKYYKDCKYTFVALLPKEDVTVSEYISSLTGEHLNSMLSSPLKLKVKTAIPKFETEYDVEMSSVLKNMGITNAFDDKKADFTGLGTFADGNIYINRVLHKTFISVGEQGTTAGATTAVEMAGNTSMPMDEPKVVYLDRPFVYMLVDCETNIPFFIGTMVDMK